MRRSASPCRPLDPDVAAGFAREAERCRYESSLVTDVSVGGTRYEVAYLTGGAEYWRAIRSAGPGAVVGSGCCVYVLPSGEDDVVTAFRPVHYVSENRRTDMRNSERKTKNPAAKVRRKGKGTYVARDKSKYGMAPRNKMAAPWGLYDVGMGAAARGAPVPYGESKRLIEEIDEALGEARARSEKPWDEVPDEPKEPPPPSAKRLKVWGRPKPKQAVDKRKVGRCDGRGCTGFQHPDFHP